MKYETIKPYIEKKLISMQLHPEHRKLAIFNYTQKCQFSKAWDPVTTNCRGLILDLHNEKVVARPFPKFFNYQEHLAAGRNIPNETPVITDKLDGSLGILYYALGEPWIATRGSFTSDQAIWATEWFRAHFPNWQPDGKTHLFEIIYPQNRIVVNYDFSGLVHLATLDTETGHQVFGLPPWSAPIHTVRQIPHMALDELEKLDEPNSEGFVLFYPMADLRLKIKFPEYVRLHKLVTGVSEVAIWEHLRDDHEFDDLLNKVPDEFFDWVTAVQTRLLMEFHTIEAEAAHIEKIAHDSGSRKEAAQIITNGTKYAGVAFAMYDGKPYKRIIWQMLRPRGVAFRRDIDV